MTDESDGTSFCGWCSHVAGLMEVIEAYEQNVVCAYCDEAFGADDPAQYEHWRTCPKSPVRKVVDAALDYLNHSQHNHAYFKYDNACPTCKAQTDLLAALEELVGGEHAV